LARGDHRCADAALIGVDASGVTVRKRRSLFARRELPPAEEPGGARLAGRLLRDRARVTRRARRWRRGLPLARRSTLQAPRQTTRSVALRPGGSGGPHRKRRDGPGRGAPLAAKSAQRAMPLAVLRELAPRRDCKGRDAGGGCAGAAVSCSPSRNLAEYATSGRFMSIAG
jgi:hypothetical protein